MNFIGSLNSTHINDLIYSASERIILALPGLFKENAEAINVKYQNGFKNIKVIINCSEKIIRQGYGDVKTIEELKKVGIPLYDQPDNLVSFIISDNIGYFLFPQSRIFLEDLHNVRNAIQMDPFSIEQIIGSFFPPAETDLKAFEIKLSDAVLLSTERIKNIELILKEGQTIKVSVLDNKKFNTVKTAIDKNPPKNPDLQRQFDFYTTNFLWIELKFNGGNILNKTISIPQNVLPIDSEDLKRKLNSSIKIFEDIENTSGYYKLNHIKNEVNKFRKKFLYPIKEKDGMNIISKAKYKTFKTEYETIQTKIESVKKEVKQEIKKEISSTVEKFKKILDAYFKAKPTKYLKSIPSQDRKNGREEFIEYLIGEINFPEAGELLDAISLTFQEYELTLNDLENDKLLKELEEKDILDTNNGFKLGEHSKGFKAKEY